MQVDLPEDDPETAALIAELTAPTRPDEARRHHTISDFYLRMFADADEWLTVVDLTEAKPKWTRRKTSNVSVAKDFYTIIDTDGQESPAVERLLGHIEGRAAPALRRMQAGVFFPPGASDRDNIALWLAFQYMRGPETRRNLEAMQDVTGKLLVQGINTPETARTRLQHAGTPEPTEQDINDLLHFAANLDQYDIAPDPNEHIQIMLSLAANEIAPRFHAMHWHLFKFDQPALLSGDHPITLYANPEHRSPLMGIGIGTADEIRFPVDPSTLLVMTPEPLPEVIGRLPHSAARHFNQLTAYHAYEFVFMHPGQDHLTGLELGPRPRPVMQVSGATDGEHSDGVNKAPKRVRPHRRKKRR